MTKKHILLLLMFLGFGLGLFLVDRFGELGNNSHLTMAIVFLAGAVLSAAFLLISLGLKVFSKP